MIYRRVEASGDAPKSQSDVCRSDTYIVINIVCKLQRNEFRTRDHQFLN